MKVYLAQTKPYLGDVEKNLKEMVAVIESQISAGMELVVFPGLSLSGYLLEEMVYDAAIKSVPEILLELSKKISIIFGAAEMGKDLYCYNTAFYLEDGGVKHRHRKVYLPTYGLFDEARYFKSGNSIEAFDTKFGRVGMLVCEDAWHQSSTYILGQDCAHYVFVITTSPARLTNNGLEVREIWEALGKSAAAANGYYFTMVNRVGVEDGVSFWGGSFTAAPSGGIIKRLSAFEKTGESLELRAEEIAAARFGSGAGKDEKPDLVLRELKRIRKN